MGFKENTEAFMKELENVKVCPVVVLNNADDAIPLAKSLRDGGLPMAEVTFRTAAAEESIRRISENVPEVIVGAGTVLTREQCEAAIEGR